MMIEERSDHVWKSIRTTNYSTNGYPTRVPTISPPSGDGVVGFGEGGAIAPKNLLLVPYGVDASTHTFSMKVLGWLHTGNVQSGNPQSLWVPVELCTIAVTLGSAAGVAGADLDTTQQFGTTITMTGGPTFITSGAAPILEDWFEISPGSNAVGMVSIRSMGFRFLEVIFTTGGVVTSCNALYAKK